MPALFKISVVLRQVLTELLTHPGEAGICTPLASASQSNGVTGVCHQTWPEIHCVFVAVVLDSSLLRYFLLFQGSCLPTLFSPIPHLQINFLFLLEKKFLGG